ncbi:Type VI protein secretion system component VasA [Duganella sp. CF458]|uniref:type VI secretion system baseplate subunit TssF n=1 Tax=Duganella sp. CF458 TaxID=1884368 RepID=UPI0008F1A08C|nr:type VI secretion system baseplate subunit TssF [Duganella sp. CF458]SFG80917.1 Type VI protein secretion system component VasA [Duganella sp. CF458]
MEKILPALEGQLRRFKVNAAGMAERHPGLARQLGARDWPPDVHVDRLVQGVAALHARTALVLQRAHCQQDEHALELQFPEQLRPFPECRIGPARQAAVLAACYCPGPPAAIELEVDPGPQPADSVDIFIDGDAAFSGALRNALLAGGSRQLACRPFAPTGLDPAEALLPRAPGAHAGLALLREYFTFPPRFNILRLDLTSFVNGGRGKLSLPVPAARPLEALQASHLRAGWAARACLRRAAAAPVRIDGRQSEYLVSVPPELEIFSIDRVHVGGAEDLGWVARRVEDAPAGHEWRIAFHGARGAVGAVASIDVTCCERDKVLARPARGAGCRWQLNSLLALEQLPLEAGALRELMATQAIDDSPASHAIINAVRALDVQPAALRPGRAAPLMGTDIRLQVDEAAFAGSGLLLFGQVMDRFFGECAHMNTFTRLVLVSAETGEELMRCKARNAGTLLE